MFDAECIYQRPAPANIIHLRDIELPLLNSIEVVAMHNVAASGYRKLDRDVGSQLCLDEIRILTNFMRFFQVSNRVGIDSELADAGHGNDRHEDEYGNDATRGTYRHPKQSRSNGIELRRSRLWFGATPGQTRSTDNHRCDVCRQHANATKPAEVSYNRQSRCGQRHESGRGGHGRQQAWPDYRGQPLDDAFPLRQRPVLFRNAAQQVHAICNTNHEYQGRQYHRNHVQLLAQNDVKTHRPQGRVANSKQRDRHCSPLSEENCQQNDHQTVRI